MRIWENMQYATSFRNAQVTCIAPTGRRATFTVCEVCQFQGGKLTSVHNYQDMVALLRQLGLIGEPA